jgi:hypothetical protein
MFPHIFENADIDLRKAILSEIERNDQVEISWKDIDQNRLEEVLEDPKNTGKIGTILMNMILEEEKLDQYPVDFTGWIELWNKTESIKQKIPNIEKWRNGDTLAFEDTNGNIQYFKLKGVDVEIAGYQLITGVSLALINGLYPGSIGKEKAEESISYETLTELLSSGLKR